MKIGIDIRTLMDARYSGVSEYTFNLVKEILKLDMTNEYRLFYSSFREVRGPMRILARTNAEIVWLKWPNKILNYFLFKLFNWPKIDKMLDVKAFFMPHINFVGLNPPYPPFTKGASRILTIHDLSFLRYPEFFSRRKNFWHKMINVKKLVKKFNIIVAVSENTKWDIVELCDVNPNKVMVIYSGVGEEYYPINPKSQIPNPKQIQNPKFSAEGGSLPKADQPRAGATHSGGKKDIDRLAEVKQKYNLPDKFILSLGTLEPRKNIEGLIRAYNELRIKNKELSIYKLIIAGGKGWKGGSIFRAWQSSSFKEDIKFLGYVDSEDKPYLYNLASIFVYPSFYEGFGFPPLEAMACGVPIVTSAVSSLPEVVGDAGILVDPYNTADITSAIEEVLSDEDLRDDLIQRGLERAKMFNWEKTAGEYLSLFIFG
ncbi:glycosyltransferase family 4 protein [Candidatus Falkowbacteria bacterium]|nr:glycosyltransferase family 4 protein [Candidatus Falkowbacteria bacterium]